MSVLSVWRVVRNSNILFLLFFRQIMVLVKCQENLLSLEVKDGLTVGDLKVRLHIISHKTCIQFSLVSRTKFLFSNFFFISPCGSLQFDRSRHNCYLSQLLQFPSKKLDQSLWEIICSYRFLSDHFIYWKAYCCTFPALECVENSWRVHVHVFRNMWYRS